MFRRILVAVEDTSDLEPVLELVRKVADDKSEIMALHVSLRQQYGGGRFPLETSDEAAFVAEAAAFELRMAGLGAGASWRHAMVGRAAETTVDEAARFGADLLVLGAPRRGEVAARIFGSFTQRVLLLSACPVLVSPRRVPSAPGAENDPVVPVPSRT
jgi:nucleotide-binding universal stress UspA family protein